MFILIIVITLVSAETIPAKGTYDHATHGIDDFFQDIRIVFQQNDNHGKKNESKGDQHESKIFFSCFSL